MFFFLIQILPWIALSTCNDDDIGPTRRILSGGPVRIEDVPYMALFRPVKATSHCGASIVNNQFVVTAAHCVRAAEMVVTVGTDRALSGGENYWVEKMIPHPQYDWIPKPKSTDIAVIKLKSKLRFSARVQPIEMAGPGLFIEPFAKFRVAGFGETEYGRPSRKLLAVEVHHVPTEKCQSAFSFDVTGMICAGQEHIGACQGDSGGPLVYDDMLVGVVSGGSGWCDKYSLFASIPHLRGFIDQAIGAN